MRPLVLDADHRHRDQHQHQQDGQGAAGPPWRPRLRHPRAPLLRSARGGGDEHPLEGVELLEALAAPDGHAIQRVTGHHDRHAGLVLQPGVEAVEEGAAAGQHDPLLHDVGGQLGRRPVQA